MNKYRRVLFEGVPQQIQHTGRWRALYQNAKTKKGWYVKVNGQYKQTKG